MESNLGGIHLSGGGMDHAQASRKPLRAEAAPLEWRKHNVSSPQMHAVLNKLTMRRDPSGQPEGGSVSPRGVPPPPAAESRVDTNESLRQSTMDQRHVSQSKALDPASVLFVRGDGGRIEKIGQGQYPIYKATVMILGKLKIVAVKGFDMDDKEDFEKEVAVQSKMRHPCLLTLIGWCEKDGMLCLVMPFKKGGDLRHMIYDNSIQLPLVKVIPIFEDVLRGLRYLHSRHILHRDLKPENILLNKSRTRAKISDFGTTRQSANAMTVFAVGTVEYCAPEVFHSAEYDSAVDIFSLGVIIWECLTRTKPWAELKQPLALKVEKKLTAGERPIIPEATPPLLRELICACWAYQPNERPTAEDLLTKLFVKLKEQLCPELIAKQAGRPQLGHERGRALAPLSAQSLEASLSPCPHPLSQSTRFLPPREDRSSDIAGSWIAGRKSPAARTTSASPAALPAAAELPVASQSRSFRGERKMSPSLTASADAREGTSLPGTGDSLLPID